MTDLQMRDLSIDKSRNVRTDAVDVEIETKAKVGRPLFTDRKHVTSVYANKGSNEDVEVSFTVDGRRVSAPASLTILEACRKVGTYIPTLCHHPRLKPSGKCGMCVVEVEGASSLVTSCVTKVKDDMVIKTRTPRVKVAAMASLKKMNQQQAERKDFEDPNQTEFENLLAWGEESDVDFSQSIVIDPRTCIGCDRCVRACGALQGMNCLATDKSNKVVVKGKISLEDSDCISCGQCAAFCPTGAIEEKMDIEKVMNAMKTGKILVAQTAPSVRVAMAEELGMEPGSCTDKYLVAALRGLGFNYVFSTDVGADLTIMEEGYEFLGRLKTPGSKLPILTSCCPGWVNFVEKLYPELIPHLSSCKSPMMMTGALIKTYFVDRLGVKPEDIYSVAVMPCTAKKGEYRRETLKREGQRDVNAVLTVRELGILMRNQNMIVSDLKASEYDNPLGEATGGAAIFGTTGGVTEAMLRTAADVVTGQSMDRLKYEAVRGMDHVKEAEVTLGDVTLKVAIVHGIKNVRPVCERIKKGDAPWHVVEVMACEGGCIGGGGMPKSLDPNILYKRMSSIYSFDERQVIRKSHESPVVTTLYKDFLSEPNSHEAHELLHTTYVNRKESRLARIKIATESDVSDAESDTDEAEGTPLTVLYGSQTGTAETVARRVANLASQLNFAVKCINIADYDFQAELENESLVIFVVSTFGMGEMPTSTEEFWEWLAADQPDGKLKSVKFSVFGLGSADYEDNFNLAARNIDRRFEELGAQRFASRAEGDDKNIEKWEAAFDPWIENVWNALGADISLLESGIPESRYHIVLSMGTAGRNPPPNCHFAKVSNFGMLTPAGHDSEVYEIEFEMPKKITYGTGYHLGIQPRNPISHVEPFIKNYGLNGDVSVCILPTEDAPLIPGLERAVTIREIFELYLDILGPTTRSFMRALSPFATDDAEKNRLFTLGSMAGKDEFVKEFLEEGVTYADVFSMFPSARPTLDHLVVMIPLIKPRLYSISSGSNAHPRNIQLTVGSITWKTPKGQTRYGLCSNYLKGIAQQSQPGYKSDDANEPKWDIKDNRIACFVKSSPLCPPKDLTRPSIMVGLGTGVAPFNGFCQHLDHLVKKGEKLGHYMLFFGCRRRADLVHSEFFERLESEGHLTFMPALSREVPGKKIYVTDRIGDEPKQIYDLMQHGNVYYCGPAGSVPKNVRDALLRSYCIGGNVDRDVAEKYFQLLEKQNRLVMEAW